MFIFVYFSIGSIRLHKCLSVSLLFHTISKIWPVGQLFWLVSKFNMVNSNAHVAPPQDSGRQVMILVNFSNMVGIFLCICIVIILYRVLIFLCIHIVIRLYRVLSDYKGLVFTRTAEK